MAVQKHELDAKSLAITGGIIGFISGILGAVFHGGLGWNSMMAMMMQSGYWGSMMGAGFGTIGLTIIGVFYGWLFATVYNYVIKNF